MKFLKLTDRDGNAALVDVSDAATIQRRYDDPTRTEIVWKDRHLFVAVRESPEEIAAMLAEDDGQSGHQGDLMAARLDGMEEAIQAAAQSFDERAEKEPHSEQRYSPSEIAIMIRWQLDRIAALRGEAGIAAVMPPPKSAAEGRA